MSLAILCRGLGTAALCCCAQACADTTGGALIRFSALAAGPSAAVAGQALGFSTAQGYEVALTRARLQLGALYLNRAVPTSGAQPTSCVLPGIYVGQVRSALALDVLDGQPQPFAAAGEGLAEPARAAEVWLFGDAIDAIDDPTVILDVAGVASREGRVFPFGGRLTIGRNRSIPPGDPALPGVNPLCKQRIVSPIPIELTLVEGGSLLLRVDPRPWFTNVDFSQLERVTDEPPLYQFRDDSTGEPERALYDGFRARLGVYNFEWRNVP